METRLVFLWKCEEIKTLTITAASSSCSHPVEEGLVNLCEVWTGGSGVVGEWWIGGRDAVMETDVHPRCWVSPSGPQKHPCMDANLCTPSQPAATKTTLVLSQQQAWVWTRACLLVRQKHSSGFGHPQPLLISNTPKERTNTRAGIFLLRGAETQREQ